MTEKNKKKQEVKQRHKALGTFVGFRPKREKPKKGAYDRKAVKKEVREIDW